MKWSIGGLSAVKFQNFHFQFEIVIFEEKSIKMITMVNTSVLGILNGNSHYRNGHFQENRENHL